MSFKVETVDEFIKRKSEAGEVAIQIVPPGPKIGKFGTSRFHGHEKINYNGASLSKHKLRKGVHKSKQMYVRFCNRFGSGTKQHDQEV